MDAPPLLDFSDLWIAFNTKDVTFDKVLKPGSDESFGLELLRELDSLRRSTCCKQSSIAESVDKQHTERSARLALQTQCLYLLFLSSFRLCLNRILQYLAQLGYLIRAVSARASCMALRSCHAALCDRAVIRHTAHLYHAIRHIVSTLECRWSARMHVSQHMQSCSLGPCLSWAAQWTHALVPCQPCISICHLHKSPAIHSNFIGFGAPSTNSQQLHHAGWGGYPKHQV